MPIAAADASPYVHPHVIRVDRRKQFDCAALDFPVVENLRAAFRAAPWYRDSWSAKAFRRAVLDALHSQAAGIVFLAPGMSFDVPPPFDDFFEPIELVGGFGGQHARLVMLSGETPTRQERFGRIGLYLLYATALVGFAWLLIFFLQTRSPRIPSIVFLMIAGIAAVVFAVRALVNLGGRWFLVPGGVAIVRRRRSPAERVTLRTPRDTAALLRYVSTGKSTVLMLELWSADKKWARAVTDREAISFLAAWRSAAAPPTLDQLRQLFA